MENLKPDNEKLEIPTQDVGLESVRDVDVEDIRIDYSMLAEDNRTDDIHAEPVDDKANVDI